jgi:hypothetical protein
MSQIATLDTHTQADTESPQYIENTHGCYLSIKIYTEDTIDIRRHKERRNSHKYDLQPPPSTRSKRDKNTNSVPCSIYHNFRLKITYTYFLILTQSNLSDMLLCTNFNFNLISDLHTTLIVSQAISLLKVLTDF